MFDLERYKRMLVAKNDAELYEMLVCPEEFVPDALAAVKNEFERRDLAPPDLADESSLTPSELLLLHNPRELLLDAQGVVLFNELDERVSEDAALPVLLAAFLANELIGAIRLVASSKKIPLLGIPIMPRLLASPGKRPAIWAQTWPWPLQSPESQMLLLTQQSPPIDVSSIPLCQRT